MNRYVFVESLLCLHVQCRLLVRRFLLLTVLLLLQAAGAVNCDQNSPVDAISPPMTAVDAYEHAVGLSLPLNPFAPQAYYHYLDQAISLDPGFMQARALKAAGYAAAIAHGIQIDGMNFSAMERVVLQEVQELLMQSPDQGLVYVAQAFIHWHHQRGVPARLSFEAALRLMPGDTTVMVAYTELLSLIEAHEQAVTTARRIVELAPDNAAHYWLLGEVLLHAGRAEEAADTLRQASNRFTPGYEVLLLLGQAEYLLKNNNVAMDHLADAVTLLEETVPYYEYMAIHVHALSRLGMTDQAQRVFRKFERRVEAEEYISASAQALAYLAMGYRDVAFDVLYRSPNEGLKTLQYIRANLLNDPVLDQSRFAELRRRIKMTGGTSNIEIPPF